MKTIIKITLLTLLLSLPLFAQSVATLTALKGEVTIQNSAGSTDAMLGNLLEEQDNIITADRSKAQIIFKDETVVTIGKNSNFSIAKYLYEDGQEPVAEFGLLKGAMRTITGKIGKIAPEKFVVKTKTATIGIRGTNFTVVVYEDGSHKIYCTYGAISVTVNGKTYIVKQGYYLSISASGMVSVQAFSPDELADMKYDNFGKNRSLKGKVSEDGFELGNSIIIDGTTQKISDAILRSKEELVQDAVQTATTLSTSESTNIVMSGLSVDEKFYSTMSSKVSLNFTDNGSSFDTTNSWIEALDRANGSGNGENDDWKFFLASTPTSYTSRDEFSTTISSVTLTPQTGSTSVNAVLVSGTLTATSDLASDDYMSWGVWNASVDYESVQSGSLTSDHHDFEGMWVTGDPTDPSVIAALSGTLNYTGKYQAFVVNATPFAAEEGVASLSVDFTAGQATLSILDNTSTGGNVNGSYDFTNMTVGENTISGGTISAGTGSASGTFYGADGKSVGGNFEILNATNSVEVKGVYEVTAP